MTLRNVLIFEHKAGPWASFLDEVFADTLTKPHFCKEPAGGALLFEKKLPEIVFANPSFLSSALTQKLKAWKQSHPELKLFHLGPLKKGGDTFYDEYFEAPEGLVSFQKRFVQHLPLPEKIRVLVLDDEAEIGAMMKDFLEHRNQPSFEVDYLEDGNKGLRILTQRKHDVLILDIKMPILDGREVYRMLRQKSFHHVPVIIFFDAISGEEMTEIRKYGNPAVVEKGGRESTMPEMMALIKKLVYFG